MYRRPKFLEVLHAIREEMSREVDYDVDLFAEMVRSGARCVMKSRQSWMQYRKDLRNAPASASTRITKREEMI
jgi:hypothetical protein